MADREAAIRDRLVERGRALFAAPRQEMPFTKVKSADKLLNDLDNYPHAFVIACIMDQQVKAERAWLIPHMISVRIGGFTMASLRTLSEPEINRIMRDLNRPVVAGDRIM